MGIVYSYYSSFSEACVGGDGYFSVHVPVEQLSVAVNRRTDKGDVYTACCFIQLVRTVTD
ncbi:hypothetical protein D3C77_752850 [compost metagenome]